MPRIENWSVRVPFAPYKAPELQRGFLVGIVYGHLYIPDGTKVQTSIIIGKKEDKVVTYSGTEYELGSIEKEYEEAYPQAKDRILKNLEAQD